jgi:hypothetical protein
MLKKFGMNNAKPIKWTSWSKWGRQKHRPKGISLHD